MPYNTKTQAKEMTETHRMVRIAVYFNQDLNDDEVMNFVDNLFTDYPNVSDYEYDHFPIQN
jgi:hypothetical protein